MSDQVYERIDDDRPAKDVGPRAFLPEDVPVERRCVAGPPFHGGPCRNAAGERIPDPVRDGHGPPVETGAGRLLDEIIQETLSEPGEEATAYLRQRWLSGAIDALVSMRRRAGLTQAQLAERLGTTQSAIARLERDDDGGYSVRRVVAYAIACGALPDALRWRSIEEHRKAATDEHA